MSEIDFDDPLSKNTARLSISTVDGEAHLSQVRELLKSSDASLSRRDSAVSINSLNEDESTNKLDKKEELNFKPPSPMKIAERKRRRSSAQTINTLSKKTKQPSLSPQPELSDDIGTPIIATKVHKKKIKKALQVPSLEYLPQNITSKTSIITFRDLILEIFIKNRHKNAFHLKPFLKVENPKSVDKIVICFATGLCFNDFNIEYEKSLQECISFNDFKTPDHLSFFETHFEYLLPFKAPGNKETLYLTLQALINVPITKNEKAEAIKKLKAKDLVLSDIVLTKEELLNHKYPIHSSLLDVNDSINKACEDWVETNEFEHDGSRTFSLDCEFCQAASGKVLTRISLINFQEEIVIDSLVKPDEEITDYVTKYSGITEEKLKDVTVTLKDIQNQVLSLVSCTDILIGHSLESDLNVLKIRHPKIIDTALLYDHPRGPPLKPSLKWLCEKFLGKIIQKGESSGEGHSSVEDAKACLQLTKLKLIEGLVFGRCLSETPLVEKINSNYRDKKAFESSMIDYTTLKDWDNDNGFTKHQANNDDEVVDLVDMDIQNDKKLIICKLRELEFNSGWSPVPKSYDGVLKNTIDEVDDKISTPLSAENKKELLTNLNDRLEKIHSSLPKNAALIVLTGLDDPRKAFKLQGIKKKFQTSQRDGTDLSTLSPEQSWDFDKQGDLKNEIYLAKSCMSFICLKSGDEDTKSISS